MQSELAPAELLCGPETLAGDSRTFWLGCSDSEPEVVV